MNTISNIKEIAGMIVAISSVVGLMAAFVLTFRQLREGLKCLLRSSILRIYRENFENKTISQYDFDNLSLLYHAYKRLGGNSFVDHIWKEVEEWTIIPE